MKIPESRPITEKEKKNKKLIKILAITLSILFIISVALVAYIYYVQEKSFKFYVDGNQKAKYAQDVFVIEGEKVYISIRDFAPLMGYSIYNGGYKQYTEDNTKCYIQNANEVASFEKDSTKIYKTIPEEETDYEYFEIEEAVKEINGKLYVSPEGMKIACNIAFKYTAEKNKVEVYTLNYYVNKYSALYPNAVITAKNGTFKNQKALLYGMLVVTNDIKLSNANRKYGVYSLNNKEIIGIKYDKVEFVENTQEFLVTTSEKKVGIVTAKGETKINPQYDTLKQIDKDLNLYLASEGKKKGVIEKNGKILIYLEYDKIGIDTTKYNSSGIKNQYILFDKFIPVQQNNLWGAFDQYGNLIVPIEYTSFGCVKGAVNNKNTNNVITIPGVEGIVVYKEINDSKSKLYGIISAEGKELVPLALETVYSITNAGREEYSMIYQNTTYDVEAYIRKYIFKENTDKTNTIATPPTNTTTSKIVEEKKQRIA